MPRIKDIAGPYRFYFFSFDCSEPKHVHVRRDKMVCKFWLEPLELCSNHGFPARDLTIIRGDIRANLVKIIEEWNEHCG